MISSATKTAAGSSASGASQTESPGSGSGSDSDSQITPPPTIPPFARKSDESSGGLSAGVIIGIGIGVGGAIAVIGALAFLLWKKSQNETEPEVLSEGGQYHGSSPPDYQPVTETTPGYRQEYKPGSRYSSAPAELESGTPTLPAELS